MDSLNWIIITMIFMFCRFETSSSSTQAKTFIVHVERRADMDDQHTSKIHSYHNSFLSVANETSIIYSYRTVISGFAAKLSPGELSEMSKKNGFISAQPARRVSLHTTHSPQFLGLNQNKGGMWNVTNYGSGVIIGIVDTGIMPRHLSFSDKGMPPPPAKWKGICEFTDRTMCNNKIIGARTFEPREKSDRGTFNDDGHGTHTSSTAAGNFVQGASYFGNANGTASGIAPLAHIAIYQICAENDCEESELLAAMDAAIHDGVDVLSLSVALPNVINFYDDIIAIGAFRAMETGIFVSCSGGNNGPFNFTMFNEAPWVLTVGASTMDRQLRATAVLGNGQQFQGQSALQPMSLARRGPLPLVYAPGCGNADSFKFNRKNIKGKAVVCEFWERNGEAVKSAGGVAMILVNDELLANTTFSDGNVLPAVSVSYADGLKIKAYINSTRTPTAKFLFGGTVIGGEDDRAPVVASFSSRGPSTVSRVILKPDVIGPGVSVLAAWPNSKLESEFNMISGTSMSCPHLSGVAALLKSAHPAWTPAAIKSAIMTTADVVNRAHNPIEDETFLPAGVFDTGSGHVNPPAAIDPGLVYDIQPTDYVPYLCGLNYTNQQVGLILNKEVDCSNVSSIHGSELNYPAFVLVFADKPIGSSQTCTRTVTNVAEAPSTYKVSVASPPGFEVRVSPEELEFTKLKQKWQYEVTFKRVRSTTANENSYVEGYLKWEDCEKHSVRSPIAIILDGNVY